MRRRLSWPHVFSRLLATACLAAGCGPQSQDRSRQSTGEIRLVDAAGVEHMLPGPASRVISLVPSATETLRALGATATLVGRTDYDAQPWASALPSVGGGIGPNLEAIVALEPDLVVRFAGEQDPRTPSRLDELGIRHVAVRPDRIDDIHATVRLLGRATGREAAADSLEAFIREGLRGAAEATAGLERMRVAYVLGGRPPMVSGPGTYIDEIISLVGGVNVFGDLSALYATVSPEEILTREVDVILLAAAGEFDASLASGARVEIVGAALELPGPGVVGAAYHVAELLHGPDLR